MNGPLLLAIKYIAHNKLKSAILIGCIFLTALLPIAIKLLLWQFNQQVLTRADQTPVVIGSKGSELDLTLHSLYFQNKSPSPFAYKEVARIRNTELAKAIPIHSKFTARKAFPIVGTSLDYFGFRKLEVDQGSQFAMIGECVIGKSVAESLGLGPGDELLSDRENVLNIAGLYPLKMQISGVLRPTNSVDDQTVFVDLKTAWIIEGLGHGHQDLADETDEGKVLSRDDKQAVASAAVLPYTKITESNLDSFHFHGETEDFPITAIIAIPNDTKSETILESQYDSEDSLIQFAKPSGVVRGLMNMIFKIKLFFDANTVLVAVATVLLLMLVILLSAKLRSREMDTMFKIGCNRGTIWLLQIWELAIVFFVAAALVAFAVWGIWIASGSIVEFLLLNSNG